MSSVDICCKYEHIFYDPDEVLCMQSWGKDHTAIYVLDLYDPKGFIMQLPSGYLKIHEQNVAEHAFFMRVYDNWIVNLKYVHSVTKNNIIKLKLPHFTEEIPLDPKLRDEFLSRRKLWRTPCCAFFCGLKILLAEQPQPTMV